MSLFSNDGWHPLGESSRGGAVRTTLFVAAVAMASLAAAPLSAQNIYINEVNRNTSALSITGNEWIELVIAEPLTAAQLNTMIVGDSQAARNTRVGAYQFTGMEGISANFPAGTIIVVAAAGSELVEDLSYDPANGDWNLTFLVGSGFLTNVLPGTMDFAGDDVAWVDNTLDGVLSGEAFGVAWRDAGGALGQSASVIVPIAPENNGNTSMQTLGDDVSITDDVLWINAAPTPGVANDPEINGLWINNLRLGIPSSDPLIKVGSRSLNFGTFADNVFPLPTQSFEIRNSALASNNLSIVGFSVSPDDMNFRVVSPTPATPFNVAPGSSNAVTVEFDPLGVPGDYTATLIIQHNDPNRSPIEVTLTGSALSSAEPISISGSLPAVYEQDFNALPNIELFDGGGLFSPYPWTNNSTIAGWYAERELGAPLNTLLASAGVGNNSVGDLNGNLYSFGMEADSDRALGSVASGGTGQIVFGARFRNDTAETLTALQIEYTGEQWRASQDSVTNALQFSYRVSETELVAIDIADTEYVLVPALDFSSPVADGSRTELDGNAAQNRQEISGLITGLSIQPGQEFLLRWKDFNDAGVDQALGIDDVRVTALPATIPTVETIVVFEPFVSEQGTPGASQSYTVTGSNLEGDVLITPPASFEVSLSSMGPWTANPSSLAVSPVDGSLAQTTVFVRLNSNTTGPVAGNIEHATMGAAGAVLVPVSGSVIAGPFVLTALETASEEDFDTLGSGAEAILPGGFAFVGASLDPADYLFTTLRSAGNTGAGALLSNSGGNYYNFGDGVNAETSDRALGFLGSGTFTSPRSLVLAMVNQTGATVTDLQVDFDIEKYRSGNRAFDFNLYFSTNESDWTLVPDASVTFPSDGTNATVFAPALSFPQSATISGLSINPGARVYLRWQYAGQGGSTNGQGLGIDNLSVTPLGEPVVPGDLGDINGDGVINVADVTALAILVSAATPPSLVVGDVNQDGTVDADDVSALANQIVNN